MTKTNPTREEVLGKQPIKDTQIHGIDKPKIVSQIEIEGASSGGGGGSESLSFIRPATKGTGPQSFSGFSFTPSRYDVVAWRSGDITATGTLLNCHSQSSYTSEGVTRGMRINPNGASQSEIGPTSNMVRVTYSGISGGGQTRATHSSLNSDGVTLNFTSSQEDVELIITCYA